MNKTNTLLKHNFLWLLFLAFGFYAVWTREDEAVFVSQGPYGFGKYIAWVLFIGFLGYSVYCGRKERFFKSVKRIGKLHWGRQIGIDLYIGLLLPLVLIYWQGGLVVLLIWLLPVLIYANLATLLYLALNYDALIRLFLA